MPKPRFLRYCKWRWLSFRRGWANSSWAKTRSDRIPCWLRFYVQAYCRLLGLVTVVATLPVVMMLWLEHVSGEIWHIWHATHLAGAVLVLLAVVLLAPAVAAYRWIRPIWLDLVMVREHSIDFSGGRFHTRAGVSNSAISDPLARTLNRVAERMERLIEAQRELTNGISHELRTPLARVRFALEILREPASAAEYSSALASIDQDMTELDELIDMSLTYARLEYSSLQANLEPTLLAAWFDSQLDDAMLLYSEREIVWRIEVDHSLCVEMDRRLMSCALRNLLRNASKYARSTILVGLEVRHGQVEIFVEDDGAGVPESEWERIFNAFVRLDRHTAGYGLGLAVTRQVLHAHRGRIRVTAPLRLPGARFELSWPGGMAGVASQLGGARSAVSF
ncbi:ATP-binding protein [Paraburkholderia bonniea]|nr:ATP-binding protein [Paraburkholderia bonniea]WJF92031.1 ATP-binding protein [Paraburkholderia bonniea]